MEDHHLTDLLISGNSHDVNTSGFSDPLDESDLVTVNAEAEQVIRQQLDSVQQSYFDQTLFQCQAPLAHSHLRVYWIDQDIFGFENIVYIKMFIKLGYTSDFHLLESVESLRDRLAIMAENSSLEDSIVITSGRCAEQILELIKDYPSLKKVIIFCFKLERYLPLKEEYPNTVASIVSEFGKVTIAFNSIIRELSPDPVDLKSILKAENLKFNSQGIERTSLSLSTSSYKEFASNSKRPKEGSVPHGYWFLDVQHKKNFNLRLRFLSKQKTPLNSKKAEAEASNSQPFIFSQEQVNSDLGLSPSEGDNSTKNEIEELTQSLVEALRNSLQSTIEAARIIQGGRMVPDLVAQNLVLANSSIRVEDADKICQGVERELDFLLSQSYILQSPSGDNFITVEGWQMIICFCMKTLTLNTIFFSIVNQALLSDESRNSPGLKALEPWIRLFELGIARASHNRQLYSPFKLTPPKKFVYLAAKMDYAEIVELYLALQRAREDSSFDSRFTFGASEGGAPFFFGAFLSQRVALEMVRSSQVLQPNYKIALFKIGLATHLKAGPDREQISLLSLGITPCILMESLSLRPIEEEVAFYSQTSAQIGGETKQIQVVYTPVQYRRHKSVMPLIEDGSDLDAHNENYPEVHEFWVKQHFEAIF